MGCEICKQPRDIDGEQLLSAELKAGAGSKSPGGTQSETLNFLAKVQLFKRLPQDQHPTLAAACKPTQFSQGQVLMRQGDAGNEFFVIVSGTVSVSIDGNVVASLTNGDYVGENALLRDEPRTATITSTSTVQTLKITREQFRELGLNEKLEFAKRAAVGGGAGRPLVVKPPTNKTSAERQTIVAALKGNQNLNTMVTLDDNKCNSMVDVAWEETVTTGMDIITQGSDDADYFYVVKDGSFDIIVDKSSGGQSADSAQAANSERVGTIAKGGSFGELALLYFAPRAATVKAKIQSTVWVIDRQNFKKILANSGNKAAEYIKYLEANDIFSSLKADEKMEVAKNLNECSFSKGETIFDQGEKGETFYILYDGSVQVVKDGKEVAKVTGTPTGASIFGELALLGAGARAATIKVLSDTAKCLSMDKVSFDLLLGPLEDIKKRGATGESKVGKAAEKAAARIAKDAAAGGSAGKQKVYRKDLTRLGLLGCGGFGAVELVEHTVSKDTFALKALSKGYIVKCGMKEGVMSEKNIQWMCDSSFIVKLYETYNGEQSLYFLLELALGGELYATYNKKGFHGSEKHAKFYIAGTVYGFEHLHAKKIIFRDLKPENLLLTDSGAIKLTDMGLAKVVVGKTYTTCGTPDYFAPELIASAGHNHAVDWWGLGILTFELMSGHPPFESAAPMQIYSKVTKGINKVSFPPKLKGSCEDLVKALCKKEPADRLPMKKGGIENVQKHSWYSGFTWEPFKEGTMDAPYKPKVKSKKDIANFSASKEDMPPQVKYKDDGSGWDKDFATST